MTALNYDAKIATLKVLDEILLADGKVNDNEVALMNEILLSFELPNDTLSKVKEIQLLPSLCILKELSDEQKSYVASLLGKMIIVDRDINYNEVCLYNSVCDYCGITEPFNIENYEDCSFSGPFIDF